MAVSEDAGNPTSLHSRFDPDKEARRFLEREIDSDEVSTALLIAPGMNYLGKAVRERWPAAKIVSLFGSRQTAQEQVAGGALSWHPELGIEPATFLRRVLREEDVLRLHLLVWPPAQRRYPDITARLLELSAAEVGHLSAGFATVAASGQRWVRNAAFHRAVLSPGRGGLLRRGRHSVVIAAAGPSLEDSLEKLKRRRHELELWALPSAILPLATRGMVPDLVVTSDPGFYARAHLRNAGLRAIACSAPITASRNLAEMEGPLALFSNGTPLERSLMDQSGFPRVAENGSVAGIALDLALMLDRNPIVFAGLDGCTRDIRSHARPSELDPFVVAGTGRFFPGEQAWLERVIGMSPRGSSIPTPRVSPALEEYAAWFRRRCRELPGRVYRVRPTAVDYGVPEIALDAIPSISEAARALPLVEEPPNVGAAEESSRTAGDSAGGPAADASPGIHKLVGILRRLTGEELHTVLTEEAGRRLAGLPRSDRGDLLFVSATRSYSRALLEPTPENLRRLEEDLGELTRRLMRYEGAVTP